MNKKDFIQWAVSANSTLPKQVVRQGSELFLDLIFTYLAHHHRVEIRGLGSFSLRQRKAYVSRNPQSGEKVNVGEKWTPFFKASAQLKEKLQEKQILRKKKNSFFQSLYS